MIAGVGIDCIEIKRFELWHSYPADKLVRIFSSQEIEYCLQKSFKSAERFAVRFAAREACYKAICSLKLPCKIPFLKMCRLVNIERYDNGSQKMNINWPVLIGTKIDLISQPIVHISLTHNRTEAIAVVILELNIV